MKQDSTQAQEKERKMDGAVADDDNGLDCLMCILNCILAPPLLAFAAGADCGTRVVSTIRCVFIGQPYVKR